MQETRSGEEAEKLAAELKKRQLQDGQHEPQELQGHPARGSHLLLTLKDCAQHILNDEEKLKELVREAATATGATVLTLVSRKFEPQGITVVAVLAESHASLHTYPESGIVFWDCFTCGDRCKPENSTPVLKATLLPRSVTVQLVER